MQKLYPSDKLLDAGSVVGVTDEIPGNNAGDKSSPRDDNGG